GTKGVRAEADARNLRGGVRREPGMARSEGPGGLGGQPEDGAAARPVPRRRDPHPRGQPRAAAEGPRPRVEEVDPVHAAFMREALAQAGQALAAGEVPVGAVLVVDGAIVGRGFNRPIATHDPTAHAEVQALRAAGSALANYRLPGSVLYATVEPCLLCVGALVQARVGTVVLGPTDPKAGAVRSILRADDLPLNHRFAVVSGVLAEECAALLVGFFKSRRQEG